MTGAKCGESRSSAYHCPFDVPPSSPGIRNLDLPPNGTESRAARLSQAWPAVAASVSEARTAVTAFAQSAGATADALAAVSLAVSEAVTNAVLHAYLDRETPGTVEVRAHSENTSVIVVVADEGRGMLPRTDSPGLGLGLPLIAQMTQSLEVHDRDGGGTEIRMSFPLDSTA